MPTFTLTVSPAEGARTMNALCAQAGLEPTQANALKVLRQFLVSSVLSYERSQAMTTALASVVEPTPVDPT